MTKLHAAKTEPPSSQAGMEARLDGLLEEAGCLAHSLHGTRAGRYLIDAENAIWKAVTLARQGL